MLYDKGLQTSEQRRFETFVKMFVGCRWADAGPLAWHKPDDEKYITLESLLAAIDAETANNSWPTLAGRFENLIQTEKEALEQLEKFVPLSSEGKNRLRKIIDK